MHFPRASKPATKGKDTPRRVSFPTNPWKCWPASLISMALDPIHICGFITVLQREQKVLLCFLQFATSFVVSCHDTSILLVIMAVGMRISKTETIFEMSLSSAGQSTLNAFLDAIFLLYKKKSQYQFHQRWTVLHCQCNLDTAWENKLLPYFLKCQRKTEKQS